MLVWEVIEVVVQSLSSQLLSEYFRELPYGWDPHLVLNLRSCSLWKERRAKRQAEIEGLKTVGILRLSISSLATSSNVEKCKQWRFQVPSRLLVLRDSNAFNIDGCCLLMRACAPQLHVAKFHGSAISQLPRSKCEPQRLHGF